MGDDRIEKLTMPKWGLSMVQGKILQWLVPEGATVESGQELVEVETDKIVGVVESPASGVLRRQVAVAGAQVPVTGLLGVIADADVSGDAIDRLIAESASAPIAEQTATEDDAPQTVQVVGHDLNYLARGQGGTPVIMIHGFGGDLNSWMFNHDAIATRGQTYALDLPGHGASSKRVTDASPETFADVLVAFMDQLDVTQAHLIGHSFGGSVALAAALKHPDRVRSLTLINSAGLGEEINEAYIDGFITAARRNQLKPVLELLFADSNLVTRQIIEETLKYKRLDGVHEALRSIAEACFSNGRQKYLYRDRLGTIAVPMLVLWGTMDQILPASHGRDLPDHVQSRVLEDCGHMTHMEAAGEVNRMIDQFIRDTDASG